MKSERRLTVEFGDDSRVDEYRIRGRQIEFRPWCRGNTALPNSGWRQLAAEDISMHLALHTVVSEWLMLRMDQGVLRRIQNPRHEGAISCSSFYPA
jgi:hypothetical protein